MTELTFFPAPEEVGHLRGEWAIHDPQGRTTDELSAVGVTPRRLPAAGDLSGVDVLVIGTTALEPTSPLPFSADDVRRGLRVVIFEQTAPALRMFGLRTEDVVPRYVFPRVGDHPILAGLSSRDLTNWRGAGELVPSVKRNQYPYPDERLHWQNHGSVASVIIETPHSGAFTAILEAEFDLAYSPLLEWQHGAGSVLFVQLDLTGRIGLEPAADLLLRNIVTHLDRPSEGRDARQDRSVMHIGSDQDEVTFLQGLGFRLDQPESGLPGLRHSADERYVVILGRGAVAELTVAERAVLGNYVRAGGRVLFLPRSAEELGVADWPSPLTTTPARLARVDPGSSATGSELLRGVGPQVLRWRAFLELDPIDSSQLPNDSEHLLDGLLVDVRDGEGSWLISQLDWRQLAAGGNNTRRSRWNTQKFYRQLLTNLGTQTDDDMTASMLPRTGRAPSVPISQWRAATESKSLEFTLGALRGAGTPFFTLNGLDEVFDTDPWPGATGDDWGQVLSADSEGYVDLSPVVPGEGQLAYAGKIAYARTYVYSGTARPANVAVGAATWMHVRVNGQSIIDQGTEGTTWPAHPHPRQVTVSAALRAGWNTLEIIVAGSYRVTREDGSKLGFWLESDDPGDLVIEPAATEPATTTPPADSPPTAVPSLAQWYSEVTPEAEDVYRPIFW